MIEAVMPDESTSTGYQEVARRLRMRIIGRSLPPGTPLPKQTELAEEFSVSNLTIGRAMRQLQEDGFIVAIRRAGSFVADSPPHLTRYALIFSQSAAAVQQNRFMQALVNEASRLSEERGITIDCFYGIDGRKVSESVQRLEQDIERQRLAGIIFSSLPFLVRNTPVLTAPGFPRAAIMGETPDYPNVAKVAVGGSAWAERACEYLAAAGKKRLAVLSNPAALSDWEDMVERIAPQLGMEYRPYWLQAVNLLSAGCARRCMHLLFHGDQRTRPDGLIIADDNLVEPATAGLVDAGINVPEELTVIAHANFPWPTRSQVSACRLGFDAGEVLEKCLNSIDLQRQSKAMTKTDLVTPLFEDEFQARRSVSDQMLPAGSAVAYHVG